MMRWRVLLWSLLLLASGVRAEPTELVLDSSFDQLDLTPHVEFYEDTSASLSAEQIQQQYADKFLPYTHLTISEGYSSSVWWFRFKLYNNEQSDSQWWLNLDYAMLDHIDLYQIGDNHQINSIATTGDRAPLLTRPVNTENFWIPIAMGSQQSSAILIRVESTSSLLLPLRLYKQAAFVNELAGHRLLLGLYHGGAFFLMLYNVGLLVVTRQRLYGYFATYVAFFLLISLTATGLGYQYLWRDSYWFQSGSLPLSMLLCLLFGLLYSRNLLALEERTPRLFQLSQYLAGLLFATIVICVFIPYTPGIHAAMLASLVTIGFIVMAGCHGLLTQYQPARLFMLAWCVFLASTVLFFMNMFNLLPASSTTINAVQTGSAIELLLLSIATASRISQLNEQKAAEQSHILAEQAANKAKSDFLGSMSHEIRAPMAGMLAMTESMTNTQLTHEQRQYLDNIQDATRSLMDIINQILDLSKIEANRLEFESLEFSINDVIAETLKVFYARRQTSQVQLDLQIDPVLPAQVHGDPTRLRQILINLIGNAYKFTEQGSITLSIQPGKHPHELHFAISDTGSGIASEALPTLFQHYAQDDNTRRQGGSGLGLNITKQLVERMGGNIGVHSQPGAGATFWFNLPLMARDTQAPLFPTDEFRHLHLYLFSNNNALQRQITQWCKHMGIEWVLNAWPKATDQIDDLIILSDDIVHLRQSLSLLAVRVTTHLLCKRASDCDQTEFPSTELPLLPARFIDILSRRHQAENRQSSRTMTGNNPILIKKVLLAEDNPVNAQVIKGLLKRLGVDSDWCQNGKEALDKIQRNQYDLIFMDCEMPILDGYAATRAIREQGDATLPVVALTAHAVKEYVDQAYAAGMNDYLTKPVDLETLRKTLQFWSSPGAAT